MAFVSSSNNNNTNGAVNIAQVVNNALGVSTAGTQVNTANIDNLSDAVICAFLASQPTIGFDKTNVECYNCHKRGHFSRECRAPRSQDTKHKKSTRRIVLMETPASTTLVSCDGLSGYDWSDQAEEGPNYGLMAYTSTSSDSKGLGYESYNAVPPPYIGNFMPLKPNFSYIGLDEFVVKPVVENKSSKEETKVVRKNPDAFIVEEWVSDNEEENSSALLTIANEPAFPVRDVSKGEACPTASGFIADQDRATIAKTSTLPHDSAPRVTSPAADEGSMQQHISELTALYTSLQREGVATKQSGEDAPIKGRSNNEGEAAAERISNDSEEIARVLTSMDAATVLAGEIDVPTGSGFVPTADPPATVISTSSEVGPTASPIVTRKKGKEVMVESDTPKKKKLQE
nr:hypothetical protein [Tanacetum cinerariifolium]